MYPSLKLGGKNEKKKREIQNPRKRRSNIRQMRFPRSVKRHASWRTRPHWTKRTKDSQKITLDETEKLINEFNHIEKKSIFWQKE